ncbi:lipopolysaccharide biosynthesis protein [Rubrivirga sp.]|uniref:lipopolysaccharide biosynthesis protein n=1 Tax=Rubrivirga sp. TaxID=1885344 RepID=UPI003B520404
MSRGRAVADRLRALAEGRSLRHVLTLVTGATAAQALLFAARPLLTRLYTPEAFGLLGVFVAPAYLLAVLATLRYEDAIAVPREPRDGAGVFALAVVAAVATGLLLLLGLPFRSAAATALGAPELAPLLVWVPLVTAALGVAGAARTWLARVERYRAMSAVVLAQAVVVVAVQVGLADAGAWGLVVGTALGAAVLGGASLALAADGVALARRVDLGALARRFRRFPLFGLPASGLGQLAVRLPPLVLVGAFGPAVVGYFTVAVASVAVPVGLVTEAVGQVFYVRAAEAERAGRLGELVERVFSRLAAFAAFPVLAVALLGPDLFAVVFSEPWRTAGEFARLLAPWLLLAAVAPPLTRVFDVTERQRSELAVGAWTAALVGAGLAVGVWTGEVGPALVALAVGGALARVVQLGWIAHVGRASGARMALDLGRSVVAASVCLVPAALALAWGGVWAGLGAAVVGGVAYAVWALPADES